MLFAVQFREFIDSVQCSLEADGILGPVHRATPPSWETVTIEVDDIDIRRPIGHSLIQNIATDVKH